MPALVRQGRRRAAANARIATRSAAANSRRAVVKARFVKLTPNGAAAAALHLRYIQRDGVERDGSPGKLYGPDGPVDGATLEQPRIGEKHQFRFIISPEDARELDMTTYVQRLMREVERDVGRPIEWAAVNHYNTAHPHAHVVIRGVDRDGRELRFDRDYISRGIRDRAQEIATQELGPRSPAELQRAREREVTQERFTSLDRVIEQRAQDRRVTRSALEAGARSPADATPLIARLQHLEAMRLAERVAPGTWTLAPDWKERLRELSEREDIIQQMHVALRRPPGRYRVVERGKPVDPELAPGRPAPVHHGRIRAKVLSDELRGTVSAVIESPDGVAYLVPLDPRTATRCRVGDCVSFTHVPDLRGAGPAPARPAVRLEVRLEPSTPQAQVHRRGPTWLDKVDRRSLAPQGLGHELRPLLEERDRVLRSWGIEPTDPARVRKLREIERRAVGERTAVELGAQFVANTPERFRGTVHAVADSPGYAIVHDRLEVFAVPMTAELRAKIGRAVSVSRDAAGRFQLQSDGPDRSR